MVRTLRWRGAAAGVLLGGAAAYTITLLWLHSGGDADAAGRGAPPGSAPEQAPETPRVAADGPGPPRAGAPPRLYCMVPSLWSPSKQLRWDEIADTWGRRCDVLRFFIDADPDAPVARSTRYEVVQIKMTRVHDPTCTNPRDKFKCRHIWEKMWRSWVWVSENEIGMADYFVKVYQYCQST